MNYLIVFLSSVSFWFMLSSAGAGNIIRNCIIGSISAVLLIIMSKKIRIEKSIINNICSVVICVFFSFILIKKCFAAWQFFSKLKTLESAIGVSENSLLMLFCIILALFSCISVFVLARMIFSIVISAIDFSSLLCKIKTLFAIKKLLKKTSIMLVCLVLSGVIGTLLMCGVYSLPMEKIEENVTKSAHELKNESTYHSLFSWCTSQLDNFTDSIMLLESSYNKSDPIINKAMLNYRGMVEDPEYIDAHDTLIKHYVEEKEYTNTTQYPRYWHGYLLIVKPLLLFFDYQTIRILNLCFQFAVVIFICVLMKIKGLTHAIIPYIISYLLLMPVALAFSLQFSACFFVFSAGSIIILLLKNRLEKYLVYIFLLLGIATSFFDFLTYPIVTFGIPAILVLAILSQLDLESKLVILIKTSLLWVIGYLGMWASKWIIGSILTGENIILDGLSAVEKRTVSQQGISYVPIDRENAIATNIRAFFNTPFSVCFIIFTVILVVSIVLLLWKRKNKINHLEFIKSIRIIIPYVLICSLPFAWYAVAVNHSCIHYWFTNKNLIITVFGSMILLEEMKSSIRKME